MLVGTPGVIAALAIRGPWAVAIAAATSAVIAWAVRRALRVSLEVSDSDVVVRNFWRDYRFRWLDVTALGFGELSSGDSSRPAIAFVLRGGRSVLAQATPSGKGQREAVLAAVERLAPPSVESLRLRTADGPPWFGGLRRRREAWRRR